MSIKCKKTNARISGSRNNNQQILNHQIHSFVKLHLITHAQYAFKSLTNETKTNILASLLQSYAVILFILSVWLGGKIKHAHFVDFNKVHQPFSIVANALRHKIYGSAWSVEIRDVYNSKEMMMINWIKF